MAPANSISASPERFLPTTLVLKPVLMVQSTRKAWSEETEIKTGTMWDAWFNYYAASYLAHESRRTSI